METFDDPTSFGLDPAYQLFLNAKRDEYVQRLGGIFIDNHSVIKRVPTAHENTRNEAKFVIATLALRGATVSRRVVTNTLSTMTGLNYSPFLNEPPFPDPLGGYWAGYPIDTLNNNVADAYNVIRSYAKRGCPPQQSYLLLLMSRLGYFKKGDPLYLERSDIEVDIR